MKNKSKPRNFNLRVVSPWIIWVIYLSLISFLILSALNQEEVPDYRNFNMEEPAAGVETEPQPYLKTGLLLTPPVQSNENWFAVQALNFFLYLPPNFADKVDTLCINNINLKFRYYSNQIWSRRIGSEVNLEGIESPFCIKLMKSTNQLYRNQLYGVFDSYRLSVESSSITARLFPNPFGLYYPYDGFQIDIASLISYSLEGHGSEVFSITNSINRIELSKTTPYSINPTHFQDWSIAYISNLDLSNEDSLWTDFWGKSIDEIHNAGISIEYQRPFYYQLLIPLTLLSIAVIIFLLTKLDNVDTLIQGAIAVVIGLLGLKALLAPPNSVTFGILDYLLICLYLELFAVVFIFLIRNRQSSNTAHIQHGHSRLIIIKKNVKKSKKFNRLLLNKKNPNG